MYTPFTRRLIAGAAVPALFAAGAVLAPAAHAQLALNAEFVVNQTALGDQRTYRDAVHAPSLIGELTDGNRIVAYNDPANTRHRVVILDPGDTPVTEIDLGASSNDSAAVAALSTGGFVAVYSDGSDCLAELFNNAGVQIVAPFNVAATPVNNQAFCDVAPLPGGEFVVTWRDNGAGNFDILARRFDNTGAAITGEIIVDGRSPSNQTLPQIEPLASGGYVLTWLDYSFSDGGGDGQYMRAYTAGNAAVTGAPVVVNGTTAGNQNRGAAAPLSNGNIAFSYSSTGDRYYRILQPDGTEVVAETLIPDSSDNGDLIALSDGRFLSIHSDDAADDIRLVEYQNDGTLLSDTEVNQTVGGSQTVPRAGVFSDDSFLFIYTDLDNALDGDSHSVLARSYTPPVELVSRGAGSDFSGQTVASEVGAVLSGDVILDFGLSGAFAAMGAGGVVEVEVTLTNATFDGIVPANAWTAASDADCDFGSPAFGGGAGGNTVRFENTGQLNLCSGGGANNGFLTLPIEVTDNGDPVSITVTFTPTADSGSYTGSDDDLDLLAFASAFDFSITTGAAGAGEFDSAGDDLQGTGLIGTLTLADFPADIESDIGLVLADATDIAASAQLVLTFPGGVTGIDATNIDLGGVACTQGAAPSDNVFTCALGGGILDAIDNGAVGLDITIDDDANAATIVTAQTPSAVLTVTGNPGNTVSGTSGDLAEIELDDGLDVNAITNSNFDWVRFGSSGTESNFRIALPSAAEAQAVTEVRVAVIAGNGVSAGTITLVPGDADTGFQVRGATITFNSRALSAASGESGNADITSVALQHDEVALLAGTVPGLSILRQLVNRTPGNFIATPGLASDN